VTALIDTSVLIAAPAMTLEEPWVISAVSVGELQAGVLMAREDAVRAQRLARLTALLSEAPIVPIEQSVATRYGELRAASRRRPANDLWIAATALAHDFTLITADERLAALPLVRARLID
jgi:predicted nucleic acid-binding protein